MERKWPTVRHKVWKKIADEGLFRHLGKFIIRIHYLTPTTLNDNSVVVNEVTNAYKIFK